MTNTIPRRSAVAAWAVMLLAATSAPAALITPPGLAAGETYQLAFVTSGFTVATSSDIAYYNGFVQAAADAAGMGSVTWRVIGSTLAVDASTNAVVSTRVYNMNGELVANDFADFWDGTHASAIRYNEDNVIKTGNNNIWTGTSADGTSGGAGDALGEATPLWGEMSFLSSGWTARGTNTNTTTYGVYALSEPLTAVPLPTAAWLLATGFAALGGRRLLRRKQAV